MFTDKFTGKSLEPSNNKREILNGWNPSHNFIPKYS